VCDIENLKNLEAMTCVGSQGYRKKDKLSKTPVMELGLKNLTEN
jgi:hypothetical protein